MELHKIRSYVAIAVTCISVSACSTFSPHTEAKKAQYVIDIPANVTLDKVTNGLKEAINYRTDNYKSNENFLPSELPAKPSEPKQSNVFSGGMMSLAQGNPQFELMNTDTSNAYYTVSGIMNLGNAFYENEAAFLAAVYPSKETTRVYLRIYYQSGSDGSLTAAFSEMTEKALSASHPDLYFLAQVESKFEEYVPSAKIVSTTPSELKQFKLNQFNMVKSS